MSMIDLSMENLIRACRGNVQALPSFCVHDDHVWPKAATVRVDSKGRIHMRRSAFMRSVVGHYPVREGLWLREDMQQFHLDLKPHHIQGDDSQTGGNIRAAARGMAKADSAGRMIGDDGYGEDPARYHRQQDIAADVRKAKEAGTSGYVRSTALGGGGE